MLTLKPVYSINKSKLFNKVTHFFTINYTEKLTLNFAAPKANAGLFTSAQVKLIKDTQTKFKDICLRIPRRPVWKNEELDAASLQLKEREAFLDWRRNLAL